MISSHVLCGLVNCQLEKYQKKCQHDKVKLKDLKRKHAVSCNMLKAMKSINIWGRDFGRSFFRLDIGLTQSLFCFKVLDKAAAVVSV